jgi:hypothetical protein
MLVKKTREIVKAGGIPTFDEKAGAELVIGLVADQVPLQKAD